LGEAKTIKAFNMIPEIVDLGGYRYIKATFSYADDKALIDEIVKKASKMAGVVNPHGADGKLRTQDVRFCKLLGGLLAESAFLEYLTIRARELTVELSVLDSTFNQEEDLARLGFNQVDLKIQVARVVKEIEIRSSFSYKTTLDRLFGASLIDGKGAFSIIGWYSSENKKAEIKKDFYIFAIHHYEPAQIQERIYDKVEIYLAGAASRETLEEKGEYSSLKQEGARFRIINPLISVADPLKVIDNILTQ
jgi:hypothetical protein